MEEFLCAYSGPIKRSGERVIEIEEGEWRNKKVLFVDVSEVHGVYATSFQEQHAGQDQADQQEEGEGGEVAWHGSEFKAQ